MNHPEIQDGLKIIACLFMLMPAPVSASIDCASLPHWVTLNNGLQVNQHHIFCGEWSHNRPKGFHSRPGGTNPSTVVQFTVQSQPNAAGIYTGRWSHKNNAGSNKFSSMFPDTCTAIQVLNSISHATANSGSTCPSGSPDWTQCGQNKPAAAQKNSLQYCSKDGEFFTIGFSPAKQGKINTAFPIFE
jgi:hypothetical protein